MTHGNRVITVTLNDYDRDAKVRTTAEQVRGTRWDVTGRTDYGYLLEIYAWRKGPDGAWREERTATYQAGTWRKVRFGA